MAEKKPRVTNDLPFEKAEPEEVIPILQSGVSWKAKLQCWTEGRRLSVSSRIVKVHEGLLRVVISVAKDSVEAAAFERALVNENVEEVMFSLHLPTDIVFFKGEFEPGAVGVFNVRVKDAIYKVQRRGALRLTIPGRPAVKLTLPDGSPRAAELLNISEGGVGLNFTQKSTFELVSSIKVPIDVAFTAIDLPVSAKALVRYGTEVGVTSRKSYRLGLEFVELDPKLQTAISQLVLEQSAKYISWK
ncbi:MAG: PilZ domain-containing protein [Bdellovibrionales bacterium]|nr:PilZ domain-containing protein [Bdellovibrionales bacterium]